MGGRGNFGGQFPHSPMKHASSSFVLKPFIAVLISMCFWGAYVPKVQAQTVPTGFNNALAMGGWNEPVGVTFDRAGALLVADDVGGVIWRVTPK